MRTLPPDKDRRYTVHMLLNLENRLDGETLKAALDGMILSPSGWRGIFAGNGDEENSGEALSPPCGVIAAAGAAVFAAYLKERVRGRTGVLLGRDTRPTGAAAADLMIRAFLASGCPVRFAGISPAPEIMAYVRSAGLRGVSGFCYISASHNPIGHNGFKFGLDDGGVLEGEEAYKLINALKEYLREDPIGRVKALLEQTEEEQVREVYAAEERTKNEALKSYRDFSADVTGREALKAAAGGLKDFPLGIAADFNGSARTLSIDEELCRSLGTGFYKINSEPGCIAHGIIPEGENLEPCRRFLEELHRTDPSVILGYVPDCDGDRGNLVIWDGALGRGRVLEAQEVFALACAAELAQLVWTGELTYDTAGRCLTRAAVAVNGPTSMRIERIADAFGVRVFRAEVGEANVVNLARRLRSEGYLVRILGEGSNGGNITHPSSVRDPLATIFALVKFMTIRTAGPGDASGGGLFDIWRNFRRRVSGEKPGAGFTLTDIIASLPAFATTGASTPEAKLRVRTADHALLKDRYQSVLKKEWELKRAELKKRWDITGWEGRACTGTEELRNLTRFGDAGTGGLKIVFKNSAGRETAFIWMRGSKTEPVFRIMADAEGESGGAELERELIAWQRAMTAAADTAQG